MNKVRITILKTTLDEELAGEYGIEGPGPSPLMRKGQVFYADYAKDVYKRQAYSRIRRPYGSCWSCIISRHSSLSTRWISVILRRRSWRSSFAGGWMSAA